MRQHTGRRPRRGKRPELEEGVDGSSGGKLYTSAGELFWVSLPTYLLMGMSAEEFWHGEPRLTVSYREAEKFKRENRYASEWRAGKYVYLAVAANLSKEVQYPSEPLFSELRNDEQAQEQRERAAMEKMKTMFTARAEAINKKLAERGGRGDEQ